MSPHAAEQHATCFGCCQVRVVRVATNSFVCFLHGRHLLCHLQVLPGRVEKEKYVRVCFSVWLDLVYRIAFMQLSPVWMLPGALSEGGTEFMCVLLFSFMASGCAAQQRCHLFACCQVRVMRLARPTAAWAAPLACSRGCQRQRVVVRPSCASHAAIYRTACCHWHPTRHEKGAAAVVYVCGCCQVGEAWMCYAALGCCCCLPLFPASSPPNIVIHSNISLHGCALSDYCYE